MSLAPLLCNVTSYREDAKGFAGAGNFPTCARDAHERALQGRGLSADASRRRCRPVGTNPLAHFVGPAQCSLAGLKLAVRYHQNIRMAIPGLGAQRVRDELTIGIEHFGHKNLAAVPSVKR